MTSFQDKLKEIRESQQEKLGRRKGLTDDELGLNDGSAECIQARDDLVRDIERLMKEFMNDANAFSVNRGFFEGKYSISMCCDELCCNDRGEVDKCYSRITFLLSPCSSDHILEETIKLTILNRDLRKGTNRGSMDSADSLEKLRSFNEAELLRFAEAYYAARQPHAIPSSHEAVGSSQTL